MLSCLYTFGINNHLVSANAMDNLTVNENFVTKQKVKILQLKHQRTKTYSSFGILISMLKHLFARNSEDNQTHYTLVKLTYHNPLFISIYKSSSPDQFLYISFNYL